MYQSLTVIGRLGRDPEMRFTPAGQPITTFSVATDRQYKDPGQKVIKITTWFRVTVWGNLAEACNDFLKKGKLVLVEGVLNCDPKTGGPAIWSGRDGEAHASFEISAHTVKFLSPKDEGVDAAASGDADKTAEEIPF